MYFTFYQVIGSIKLEEFNKANLLAKNTAGFILLKTKNPLSIKMKKLLPQAHPFFSNQPIICVYSYSARSLHAAHQSINLQCKKLGGKVFFLGNLRYYALSSGTKVNMEWVSRDKKAAQPYPECMYFFQQALYPLHLRRMRNCFSALYINSKYSSL